MNEYLFTYSHPDGRKMCLNVSADTLDEAKGHLTELANSILKADYDGIKISEHEATDDEVEWAQARRAMMH